MIGIRRLRRARPYLFGAAIAAVFTLVSPDPFSTAMTFVAAWAIAVIVTEGSRG